MTKKICISLLFLMNVHGIAYAEMANREEGFVLKDLTKEKINAECIFGKSECESQSSFDFDMNSQTTQRCRYLRNLCWKEAKDSKGYSWCTENIVCVPPRVKEDCSRLFPCSDIYRSVEFKSESLPTEQPQS